MLGHTCKASTQDAEAGGLPVPDGTVRDSSHTTRSGGGEKWWVFFFFFLNIPHGSQDSIELPLPTEARTTAIIREPTAPGPQDYLLPLSSMETLSKG